MLCQFVFIPQDEGLPVWLENEDLEALKKEAYGVIEKGGSGQARFIINGKTCKVSMPTQVYFIENPDGKGAPVPLNSPASPTFDETGKTAFLVERPSVT